MLFSVFKVHSNTLDDHSFMKVKLNLMQESLQLGTNSQTNMSNTLYLY